MSFETDVASTIKLAALVEDRDRSEAAALLRLAHWVDRRLNAQTTTNPLAGVHYLEPSRVAKEAGCTDPHCAICTGWPDRSVPPIPPEPGISAGQEALDIY